MREEKLGREAADEATAFAVRAQARAGELEAAMQKSKGGRPDKTGASRARVSEYDAALKASGITKRQAQRHQQMASVPEDLREKVIASAMADPEGGVDHEELAQRLEAQRQAAARRGIARLRAVLGREHHTERSASESR